MRRGASCVADGIGVVGVIEADDEIGDAIALQQPLRGGQRDAQIARIHFGNAGFDDADDLHIDAVQRAVGSDGKKREPIAHFHVHGFGQASADQSLGLAALNVVQDLGPQSDADEKPRLRSATGSTALPIKTEDFCAVRDHAVELDAGRDAADVRRRCDTVEATWRQFSMPVSST